jgi:hypothetical protein
MLEKCALAQEKLRSKKKIVGELGKVPQRKC